MAEAAAAAPQSGGGAALGLSFADFLERMKDPAAADLVRNIKRCAVLQLGPSLRCGMYS